MRGPFRFTRRTQPQAPTQLDKANPYVSGLMHAWVGSWVVTRRGIVSAPYGSPTASPYGVGGAGNGTSTQVALPADAMVGSDSTTPFGTRLVLTKIGAAAGNAGFAGNGNGGNFWRIASGGAVSLVNTGSAVVYTSATGIVSANEYCCLAVASKGQFNGDPVTVYKNGLQVASSTVGNGTGAGSATGAVLGSSGASSSYYDGSIFAHFAWERVLTAAEIAAISANPWQLFLPDAPLIFLPSAGGTTTYNLTMSEAASLADVSTLALTAALSLTESGTAGDALSAAMLASLAIAEAASGSDVQTSALGAAVSIAEAGSSTDLQSSSTTMPKTVGEAGAAVDAPLAAMNAALTVAEAGSATDFQTTAATYGVSVTESGTATDMQSLSALMALSMSEAAFAVDAQSAGATMAVAVSEAATAVDLVSQGAVYLVAVSESGSATDVQTIFNGISLAVAETMAGGDLVSQLTTIYAAVVEAGYAVDSTSCFNPSALHQSFKRTVTLSGRTFVVATPSRVLAVIKPANTTVAPYDPSETGP
ncbi:LamG-like jellyroll fold domain-containing protein [Rhodoferax sp. GW822-FHT02A01]|uniref:LamG-like jellyroll fold domain-containing protein n=1 Tax=Rhodoferax sp. GW822-FHT02A01 TaxID=3141537 RepID=UPI00315DBD35